MSLFRPIILVVVLASYFLSAQAAEVEVSTEAETVRLNNWLNARYEEELQRSPRALTYLGRKELYDQMDDYSEAGRSSRLEQKVGSVALLRKEFDYTRLSPEGRTSYDIWVFRAMQEASGKAFWRKSYIFNQFSGYHTSFANFLINFHNVDTVEDMKAYIARITGSAVALRQLLHRAKMAADEGVRPPRFTYRIVIEESRKLITGMPFEVDASADSPLWADAKLKIAELNEKGLLNKGQSDELQQQAMEALQQQWQPAYQEVISWMESDLPMSDAMAKGVSSLPDGKVFYDYRVALNTQSTLSANDIHQVGLDEVARIREEMGSIKQAVGFTGSLESFLDFVREDGQFYFQNTDEGRQAYMDETRAYLDHISQRLPDYFGLLPRASLEVRRVEAFREQDGAAAFYQPGTVDGSRPGAYYLHLSDMTAMNKTDLETTAYHEGSPGHHMQGAIAMELQGLPLFRTLDWSSAYGEGWALYAESLAKEMGAFENPYYDFGRLAGEIWRAVRLVVDTGIHARGWSEQQAIDYVLANTASPEAMVRSEVQRYFVAPGQALSYKMGMLKILELRAGAKKALGKNFDIRGFHDVVLGGGSVPLPLLERAVNDWVVSQGH